MIRDAPKTSPQNDDRIMTACSHVKWTKKNTSYELSTCWSELMKDNISFSPCSSLECHSSISAFQKKWVKCENTVYHQTNFPNVYRLELENSQYRRPVESQKP